MKKNETNAEKWKIHSVDSTGSLISGKYICPFCGVPNYFYSFNSNPDFVTSGRTFYLEDECGYCNKKIEVNCDWSALENPENIRVVANYWKAYLRNELDHDEYTILANYTCPNCNCTTDYWFKVSRREFESNHEYTLFHKCQCCGTNMRMVLENSDRHR